MRSGSHAQDGGEGPGAQRIHSDEATSGPVRYGPGPRSDPHEGPGGRQEAPFGPEISWPYGFRQLDPESREVLESAYGSGPVYQQPAMDDYGYGDPGYSDPSYDGPRTLHAGPAFQAHSPAFQAHSPAFQAHSPAFQAHSPAFQAHSPAFQGDRPALQLPDARRSTARPP